MHDLADVIERQRRIILLCDAGVGKSTELKRIAALCSQPGSRFHVELISLNKYVNQSIPEMLCTHWAQVPGDQLFVILDGFDELRARTGTLPFDESSRLRMIILTLISWYPAARIL